MDEKTNVIDPQPEEKKVSYEEQPRFARRKKIEKTKIVHTFHCKYCDKPFPHHNNRLRHENRCPSNPSKTKNHFWGTRKRNKISEEIPLIEGHDTCRACGVKFEKYGHLMSHSKICPCRLSTKYKKVDKLSKTCFWCGAEFKKPSIAARHETMCEHNEWMNIRKKKLFIDKRFFISNGDIRLLHPLHFQLVNSALSKYELVTAAFQILPFYTEPSKLLGKLWDKHLEAWEDENNQSAPFSRKLHLRTFKLQLQQYNWKKFQKSVNTIWENLPPLTKISKDGIVFGLFADVIRHTHVQDEFDTGYYNDMIKIPIVSHKTEQGQVEFTEMPDGELLDGQLYE